MTKKKAIKVIAASAIAASSFAAVAPSQADAATSVSKQVSDASKKAKAAYDKYFKAKSYVSTKTMDKLIASADAAYKKADKAVKSDKSKKKKAYQASLKTAKTQIDRAKGYRKGAHEAYYANKALATKAADLEKALVPTADLDKVGADLKAFGAELTKAKKAIKDTIYGANAEKIVYAKYTNALDSKQKALAAKYAELAAPAAVQAVTATDSKTITLTGTNLYKLTAADVTVADNKVSSFTASADGKTATVVLEEELVVDVVTKVTVKEVSFDVVYKVEATTVAVEEATYDDDTANQFVAIKVDGRKVTAQELINAGYTVSFEAFDTKAATNPVTTNLFKSNPSATGELATDLATQFTIPAAGLGLYVKVTIAKGSDVVTSDLTKITIKNIDLAAESITEGTLVNYGKDGKDAIWAADFYQNSSTLVTGETAEFEDITVKAGTESETVSTGFTVKSSDASVVSVDSAGVLTAEGPGTATITVTYGSATYTKTITVKNENRVAAKVTAEKTSIGLTSKATVKTTINLLDQYGDPMPITATNLVLEESNATVVGASVTAYSTDESCDAELTLAGTDSGAGTSLITFRDAKLVKIGTTAIKVTVSENDTLAQYSLTVDSSISSTEETALGSVDGDVTSKDVVSTDATLDLQSDKFVKINIAGLNSAGVTVNSQEVDGTNGDYTVVANESSAGVLDTTNPFYAEDGYILVKAGSKPGTVTLTVTNANNSKVVKSIKLTVTSVGYNVTGATLKTVAAPTYAQTLTYKNFLTYKAAEKDPVISGLTLSKAAAQSVRLDIDGDVGSSIGMLYIDKDADGEFNNNDIIVGSVAITTSGTIADAGSYTDVVDGIDVASGDEGTVLFKVLNTTGGVVATKAVKVDF